MHYLGGAFGAIASFYAPSQVWFSVLCAAIGGVLLGILSNISLRSTKKLIGIVILLAGAVLFSYVAIIDGYKTGQQIYTITNVNARSSPELDSPSLFTISRNTKVFYGGRSWRRYRIRLPSGYGFEYWRKIEDQSGRTGWVYGEYLGAL